MTTEPADGPRGATEAPASRRRFALLYVLPTLLLLAAAVWPLVTGERTLYLRDVLNTHFEMRWAQAEAMRQGYLPLVDPWRAGGQPHLGNPNTGALYPDSALLWFASPLWALNAHFWLHLLIAPFAGYWLGRAWGLGREGAWATGVAYAASGFLLSAMNLYNLMAGLALAPALTAAVLRLTAEDPPRWAPAAAGAIWALLLLGGDPMTAALALVLALAAAAFRGGARRSTGRPARRPVVAILAALALGTLAALPLLVEFLRVLPQSYRGYWGFSEAAATIGSWDPRTALEWLLPLAFGRPDLGFWGRDLYGGELPLFYSLAPGVVALALVAASGRPRGRAARWAWAAIAAGGFLALGRFNPAIGWLLELGGRGLLRLPVKLWLAVALGASLLAGLGFERALAERHGRRAAGRALAALAAIYGVSWLALAAWPEAAAGWLRGRVPAGFPDALVDQERLRWSGLCLLSLALVALAALLLRLAARRPAAGAALLALHAASQLFFLRPLLATDEARLYEEPPALVAEVPARSLLAHGKADDLFGPQRVPIESYPDLRLIWLQRQTWAELFPYAAARWGRRAELAISPEGLDAFLTRATSEAVRRLPDAGRLRVLEASGVDRLLLGRRLEAEAEAAAELLRSLPTPGGEIHLYRLPGAAEEVQFVGRVRRSPHLNDGLEAILDPGFDPRRDTVLAGEGPELAGEGGRVGVLRSEPEELEIEVEAASAGALVVQRTFLPIWRAEVDGRAAPIRIANLHRMAVELGPGRHRVTIRTDRRPLAASSAAAALGIAGLFALLARPPGRGPGRPASGGRPAA